MKTDLFQSCWKSENVSCLVCPTLCDLMDYSLPGSSVYQILQAKILDWVVISSFRGSSLLRNWTLFSCISGRFFTVWVTMEAPKGKQGYPEQGIQDDDFLIWGGRVWVKERTILIKVGNYKGLSFSCITTNKASGGDGIPVELFQILKDDAVRVLHSISQPIWKTQQWPQDWKRSVFIPIPKKGNAKECSNHCTIALISHTSKVMLKILQARL